MRHRQQSIRYRTSSSPHRVIPAGSPAAEVSPRHGGRSWARARRWRFTKSAASKVSGKPDQAARWPRSSCACPKPRRDRLRFVGRAGAGETRFAERGRLRRRKRGLPSQPGLRGTPVRVAVNSLFEAGGGSGLYDRATRSVTGATRTQRPATSNNWENAAVAWVRHVGLSAAA